MYALMNLASTSSGFTAVTGRSVSLSFQSTASQRDFMSFSGKRVDKNSNITKLYNKQSLINILESSDVLGTLDMQHTSKPLQLYSQLISMQNNKVSILAGFPQQ